MAQARQCLCFIGSARRPRERRVATTSGLGARATALFASQRAWVRDARASDTRNRRKRARQMGAASMHQNPLLTLDALAPCGVVLPTEARAALDTSLTLKARELGVLAFLLWGKFTTSSGRDYYVARATGRRGWTERSSSTRGTSFTTASTARSGWIWSRWTASWASCAG